MFSHLQFLAIVMKWCALLSKSFHFWWTWVLLVSLLFLHFRFKKRTAAVNSCDIWQRYQRECYNSWRDFGKETVPHSWWEVFLFFTFFFVLCFFFFFLSFSTMIHSCKCAIIYVSKPLYHCTFCRTAEKLFRNSKSEEAMWHTRQTGTWWQHWSHIYCWGERVGGYDRATQY